MKALILRAIAMAKYLPLVVQVVVPILLAALAIYAYQAGRIRKLERVIIQTSFRADSIEASADISRVVILTQHQREVAGLADSITVTQRRAIQAEQQRDGLDRALQLERRARAVVELHVDSLLLVVSSVSTVTETTEGVRSATFAVDSTPFHGSVSVSLPPAPARGSLSLQIGIDPITIDQRISCGEPPAGSVVRPATVTITSPPWAQVRIGRVEQDQAICNQAVVAQASTAKKKAGIGPFLGVGAAYGIDRTLSLAALVGFGIVIR